MTNEQLMYAAILALTPQNQAFKLAPLSTQTMQGVVINRNIAVGETVVCWENNSGELTRVADVPAHQGEYFVDDLNRMFYKKSNEDILVECNALTGEIVDDTEECYRFVISGDGQCAAFCIAYDIDESWSRWYVMYKDGTLSRMIRCERPLYSSYDVPRGTYRFGFGYRNGILAIVYSDTPDTGQIVTTYTQEGVELYTLAYLYTLLPQYPLVCPINEMLVGIYGGYSSAFWNYDYASVWYFDTFAASSIDPTDGYDSYQGEQYIWIGTDGVYAYLAVRIYAAGAWQDEWDILKIGIDAYSRTKVKTIEGALSYEGRASTFGHIVQQVIKDGVTTRKMIDISTMNQVFAGDLPDPPKTYVQENNGWIWVPDSGVYQKTPLDWLMMPSGEYPRDEPWGKCGYAIGNYKVGQEGLAIVLFE